MKISQNGMDMIENFESLRFVAYQDQRGIWTLGWGRTAGVVEGMVCTQAQADAWLEEDLATAEGAVDRVPAPLYANQFNALVSLCYNIGAGAFHSSTVFKRLSLSPPDYAGAASAILMWDKVNGETNPGLVRRRQAEQQLFLTPEPRWV